MKLLTVRQTDRQESVYISSLAEPTKLLWRHWVTSLSKVLSFMFPYNEPDTDSVQLCRLPLWQCCGLHRSTALSSPLGHCCCCPVVISRVCYCQRSLVCQWRQEGPKLFPCTLHARGFEIDVKGLHHIPTEKTIVFTVDTHGHASSSSPQLLTGSVMRQRGYLGQNCAVYAVSLRDGKESKFLRSLFGFFDDQGSVLFGYKYF